MVGDRLTDGVRIAQLLASEVDGNRGRLQALAVTDADPDVEPTADGAFAYAVRYEADEHVGGDGNGGADTENSTAGDSDDALDDAPLVAEVYVQSDRARVEFVAAPDAAADAGGEADLRTRPKAVRPPRTLVFVEDGAQVKWVLPVFEAVLAATERVEDAEAGNADDEGAGE